MQSCSFETNREKYTVGMNLLWDFCDTDNKNTRKTLCMPQTGRGITFKNRHKPQKLEGRNEFVDCPLQMSSRVNYTS